MTQLQAIRDRALREGMIAGVQEAIRMVEFAHQNFLGHRDILIALRTKITELKQERVTINKRD